ncbi:uncharacterized protein [Watersipora subatra]|uniref:uncharacterized protein n=1 Tax=Watersipora subatra TaxID=2589382 RepID=UPI00355B2F71
MQSVKTLQVLNDCIENERMVEKLPEWLQLKWIRVVAKADSANKTYPDFKELAEFINEGAHILTLPISQTMISLSHKPSKHNQSDKLSTKNRAIKSFAASIEQKKECICCKSTNHNTADCYRLQKRSKPEKEELIRKNGLCFKCLEHGHLPKDCDKKINCMKCKKGHATANHDSNYQYGKATSHTAGSTLYTTSSLLNMTA